MYAWEGIYSWVPAVSFITMTSSLWRHLHFEHSPLVSGDTHN